MTSNRNRHRTFQIGRATVRMTARDPHLLRLVGDWLRGFEIPGATRNACTVRLTLVGFAVNDRISFRLPEGSELLYRNDYTRYYGYRDLWIILLQSATVIINRRLGRMTALVHTKDLERMKYLEDFMHPLVELLRQNGVYAHHAAAVSEGGRGLLLLGKSGQGKTTMSVDLLSRGFDFLADDRCFLQEDGDGWEAFGYYEPIRYYPVNVAHIPRISEASRNPVLPRLSGGKDQLDLTSLYPERIIRQSRIHALVFPHYDPEEAASRLEPMSKGEALITLLPLTMVCFDRTTSQSHFDFCTRLTMRLPCVRLVMGRDKDNWSKLIRRFLASLPAPETRGGTGPRDPRCS